MAFNKVDHQRDMQQRRSDAHSSNKTMMWVVGALAVLAFIGVLFYAVSNMDPQTASTSPAVTTGSSPTTVTHSSRDEPRTPAANEPTTPTPTPAPMAPKTPPSR
jgi:type IV secretory pathway VirB10-like protein